MSTAVIRPCVDDDWRDVRRLHIKLALAFPVVVDVDLNDVLAAPDDDWHGFVQTCALDGAQELFVAEVGATRVGMGHVRLQDTRARLDLLYVDAGERRRGIATELVAAQGSWARALGATELVGHIPDGSIGARLAEKLGWRTGGEVFYTPHGLKERKWTSPAPAHPG
ncbi:MAG: N-acetyltransferase family protein [Acidimicrobiales bacterium]